MKLFCLITTIAVFFLICSNGIQAQTTETKLNQVELAKQFVGSWIGEIAKDTTLNWDIKSIGTGIKCNYRYVTKGKTVVEGEQLWGYVKEIDKYIIAVTTESQDIAIGVIWFNTKNKYELIFYKDISNPEKASMKYEGEFKSPETFVETFFMDSKPVKTYGYKRIK